MKGKDDRLVQEFFAFGRELFYHKKCKFTFQGVDQTLRRPLAVLLSEIAVEDRTTSKISGQFQKAKLRLRRLFSLQPKVQHYSAPASLRVTSLCGVGCLRNFVRNKAFLIPSRRRAFVLCVVLFRRRQKRQAVFGTVTATCHPEGARRASRSFCSRGAKHRASETAAGGIS